MLVLLLAILVVVYPPGALLFFRNDWTLIHVIDHTQPTGCCVVVCHFVIYYNDNKLRHIVRLVWRSRFLNMGFTVQLRHYLRPCRFIPQHVAGISRCRMSADITLPSWAPPCLGAAHCDTLFGRSVLYIGLTCITLISICLHPSESDR